MNWPSKWTPADDAYLEAAWNTAALPAIASALGRTPTAIWARALRLGFDLDGPRAKSPSGQAAI